MSVWQLGEIWLLELTSGTVVVELSEPSALSTEYRGERVAVLQLSCQLDDALLLPNIRPTILLYPCTTRRSHKASSRESRDLESVATVASIYRGGLFAQSHDAV